MTTYSPGAIAVVCIALGIVIVCVWIMLVRWVLRINTIVARLEEACWHLTEIEKHTTPPAE
jgi:hypothetical protein